MTLFVFLGALSVNNLKADLRSSLSGKSDTTVFVGVVVTVTSGLLLRNYLNRPAYVNPKAGWVDQDHFVSSDERFKFTENSWLSWLWLQFGR